MPNKNEKLKNVLFSEETRVLLNKVKSKILNDDPNIEKLTDEKAVKIAFEKFLLRGK